MAMLQPDQPLWLPRGSIRALLTLAIVLGSMVILAWKGNIPEVLSMAFGVVIRDYFEQRKGRDAVVSQ